MIRVVLLALACLAVPSVARAQAAPPVAFLETFDFHFGLDRLSGDDPRFVWNTRMGAEIGIVTFHGVALKMFADYEGVIGSQYQPFDPLQANYEIGGTLGTTVRGFDVAAILYHQSRHLGDRPKRDAIAWNMWGGRLGRQATRGPVHLDADVGVRWTTQRAFVDYTWEADGRLDGRYTLRPSVALIGAAEARRVGTDGSRARGDQTGFRAEAGFRFARRAATLDVFGAVERRIDPYQLEFGTATWAIFGMRILSR